MTTKLQITNKNLTKLIVVDDYTTMEFNRTIDFYQNAGYSVRLVRN